MQECRITSPLKIPHPRFANLVHAAVSWLSKGPDSSGEVWIGRKSLILKLSKVLSVKEVKSPYMRPN